MSKPIGAFRTKAQSSKNHDKENSNYSDRLDKPAERCCQEDDQERCIEMSKFPGTRDHNDRPTSNPLSRDVGGFASGKND